MRATLHIFFFQRHNNWHDPRHRDARALDLEVAALGTHMRLGEEGWRTRYEKARVALVGLECAYEVRLLRSSLQLGLLRLLLASLRRFRHLRRRRRAVVA